MKLKYSFEYVDMGDEIIAVPVGPNADQVHGVIRLNKEGQEIVELLKDGLNHEQIIERLAEKYDNDRQSLTDWITNALETLHQAGLVEY